MRKHVDRHCWFHSDDPLVFLCMKESGMRIDLKRYCESEMGVVDAKIQTETLSTGVDSGNQSTARESDLQGATAAVLSA